MRDVWEFPRLLKRLRTHKVDARRYRVDAQELLPIASTYYIHITGSWVLIWYISINMDLTNLKYADNSEQEFIFLDATYGDVPNHQYLNIINKNQCLIPFKNAIVKTHLYEISNTTNLVWRVFNDDEPWFMHAFHFGVQFVACHLLTLFAMQ